MTKRTSVLGIFSLILLAVLFLLPFTHKINLVIADLGRHIVNGRLVIEEGKLIATNYYSYTNPNFAVPNHHWGSGVVFYVVYKLAGFIGLDIFFLAVSLSAFLAFILLAKRFAGMATAVLLGLASLPLVVQRTEVRPEVFSYLFFALMLTIFATVRGNPRFGWQALAGLAIVQLLWVNMHVYFFLAFVVLAGYAVEESVQVGLAKSFRKYSPVSAVLLLASLANPEFVGGVTEPLTIFGNYGYELVENKSIWYLERYFGRSIFTWFKLLAVAFAGVAVYGFKKLRVNMPIALLLLAIFALCFAALANRNIALAGYTVIVAGAALLHALGFYRKISDAFGLLAVGVAGGFVVLTGAYRLVPNWRQFGVGLERDNLAAIEFVRDNTLPGPIFNNYDIGGYLVFGLYPDYQVFVDNRPEAYPASFFTDIYISAQTFATKWQELDDYYHFGTIVVTHTDLTQWGRVFVHRRLSDATWVPVFKDDQVIVFVRSIPQNADLIARFGLQLSPKDTLP